VKEFKFLNLTKGGQALLCKLKNPLTEEETTIWVPDRIARKVKTDEHLEKLNKESFYFKFMGRDADRLNMACFELIPVNEINSQEKFLK